MNVKSGVLDPNKTKDSKGAMLLFYGEDGAVNMSTVSELPDFDSVGKVTPTMAIMMLEEALLHLKADFYASSAIQKQMEVAEAIRRQSTGIVRPNGQPAMTPRLK